MNIHRAIIITPRLITTTFCKYFTTTTTTRPFTMSTPTTRQENDLIFAPETEQYTKGKLEREDLNPHPEHQFHHWFEEAKKMNVAIPESLTLSTCRLPSGRISSRIVLMKELDKNGNIVIYSNWGNSKKALDVKSNNHVALTFWWKELERQIRVEGAVEFLSNEESQVYFDTRPRASRIGAWASPQSQPIENRQELDDKVKQVEEKFEGQDRIPCPEFWGGIRVKPLEWEFFQGRKNRTHDRFSYTRDSVDTEEWTIQRLAS